MKKFLTAMCAALLATVSVAGFAACGGNTDGSQSSSSNVEQSVKDAPVITNKPTGNTLTITGDKNT